MSSVKDDLYLEYIAQVCDNQNIAVNKNGGIYSNGKSYEYTKKIEVAVAYKVATDGRHLKNEEYRLYIVHSYFAMS